MIPRGPGPALTAARLARYTLEVAHDDALPGDVLKTDERTRRILDAAVGLAEAGGFAAVRLRDVAQTSGVALGTLYKRFKSKEDLLVGVLSHEVHELRAQLASQPIQGPTPLLRVIAFFRFVTEFLCRRPNLGRAVVRSAASGEQALSERLARFHGHLFELSFAAMQAGPGRPPTPGETVMLSALQQVWFSALCGWAGSLYGRDEVGNQVAAAARLMTHGVDRLPPEVAGPTALRVLLLGPQAQEPAPLQQGEARVEFVAASTRDPAGPAIDVVHVVGAAPAVAELAAAWGDGPGDRPRVVVLESSYEDALAAALALRVDAVLGAEPAISPAGARRFCERLYLALARGWALRDAFDEAREALRGPGEGEAHLLAITTRPGADLRALSLR